MIPIGERDELRQVTGFLDELAVGLIASSIYWTRHPRVEGAISNLCQRIRKYCEDTGRDRLILRVVEGCVVHEGKPLLGASLTSPKVVRKIEELGSGGFEIDSGCWSRDFGGLLQVLTARPGQHADYLEANTDMKKSGCRKVRLLKPFDPSGALTPEDRSRGITPAGDRLDARALLEVPHRVYQGLVDCLQSTMMELSCGRTFEFGAVGSLVDGVLKTLDDDPAALQNLARYEEYDAFTFGHSIRVCTLTLTFARTMTSDQQLLQRIGVAALMHDVGKAKLPFELLHSREDFSAEERLEMQKHTIYGGELLLEMDSPDPMAVAAAFGHHRAEDERGYPSTILPLPRSRLTRMLKICDVYEALTAMRPYKPPMTTAQAFQLMLSMDGQFEPGLLRRFIESIGIFPNGSQVRLSSGETARVERQTARLDRPVVTVKSTPEGEVVAEPEQILRDLSLPETGPPITATAELLNV